MYSPFLINFSYNYKDKIQKINYIFTNLLKIVDIKRKKIFKKDTYKILFLQLKYIIYTLLELTKNILTNRLTYVNL